MQANNSLGRSYLLPLSFAMTVSMWAAAYLCRLPAVMAPSWVVLAMMLAAVAVWGWLTGNRVDGSWRSGVYVGAVAAVLNMLILGSLLRSAEGGGLVPSALWWIPGSILAVAVVAGGFAAVASAPGERSVPADWTALFSKVAVAATFLLVVAGGLVTSNEAGLAVVDWPNTFGSNMFLYPLARMTGGIYYEHAHRLFGALVGLTMVVLAVRLWRLDERLWVRRLALASVVVVMVQGLLGGLRVTGSLTLSTSPEEMTPSIALAIIHGVLGQVFLGMVVALAVLTSRWWRMAPPEEPRATVTADRNLQRWLVLSLVVQLVLGAVQRHLAWGLVIHVSLAAVVVMLAVVAGARAWGLYHGVWPVQRLGQLLLGTVSVQVTLGIAALAVTLGEAVVGNPTVLEVMLATAHQATGAVLLGIAVTLHLWTRRIFR
ncbi:MAG: COX15/CtaA family protein [Thermoanaerobaculales bacterium]